MLSTLLSMTSFLMKLHIKVLHKVVSLLPRLSISDEKLTASLSTLQSLAPEKEFSSLWWNIRQRITKKVLTSLLECPIQHRVKIEQRNLWVQQIYAVIYETRRGMVSVVIPLHCKYASSLVIKTNQQKECHKQHLLKPVLSGRGRHYLTACFTMNI